ncbi:MAG: hypothetical protein ACLSAH_23590 [Bilophila wadsworthia]
MIANIQASVFYVGGSKGGVGKSLFPLLSWIIFSTGTRTSCLWIPIPTTGRIQGAQRPFPAESALPPEQSGRRRRMGELLDTVQNYPDMPWSSMPPPAPRPARPATATS